MLSSEKDGSRKGSLFDAEQIKTLAYREKKGKTQQPCLVLGVCICLEGNLWGAMPYAVVEKGNQH